MQRLTLPPMPATCRAVASASLLAPCWPARQPLAAPKVAPLSHAAWRWGRPGFGPPAAVHPRLPLRLPARRFLRCAARLVSSRDSLDEELLECSCSNQQAGSKSNGRAAVPPPEPPSLQQQAAVQRQGEQQQQQLSSPPLPPEPPEQARQLTLKELQALTELHVEDAYAVGVVGSSAELAACIRSDLRDGLCETQVRCWAVSVLLFSVLGCAGQVVTQGTACALLAVRG